MSKKDYYIPEGVKPVNFDPAAQNQSTEDMFASEKARIDKELAEDTVSMTDIVLDDSNEITFPGSAYRMRALNEKITVVIDLSITGYECKRCKGKKKIKLECSCVTEGHPGRKYSASQIKVVREAMGDTVADARALAVCQECDGHPSSTFVECPECHGNGGLIIIPKKSKNLPQTGVVVSMGKVAREKAEFKIGDRILFGEFSGQFIPTKAGVALKTMDWYNALNVISGAEELSAFNFIEDMKGEEMM